MRSRSPALRTLPSSTVATLSLCPTSRRSTSLPLKENADVRAATLRALIRDSAFSSSSAMPSEKYSCSGSLLMLTKGSTAIELRVPPDACGAGPTEAPAAGDRTAGDPVSQTNLSSANSATATASTPMIRKSSRRPVRRVADTSRGTSSVRFNPCGVSSKAQANTSASGNPRNTSVVTTFSIHVGAPKSGNSDRGDLDRHPAGRTVGNADPDDIAPLQLGPETAHSAPALRTIIAHFP